MQTFLLLSLFMPVHRNDLKHIQNWYRILKFCTYKKVHKSQTNMENISMIQIYDIQARGLEPHHIPGLTASSL